MVFPGKTLDLNLQPAQLDLNLQPVQTADMFTMQLRHQIKSELKHNQKVKALLREGRQPQGVDWVRSKQAQCAILGHVPPVNGMKCYFCGVDL